jgi:hypothetical protein
MSRGNERDESETKEKKKGKEEKRVSVYLQVKCHDYEWIGIYIGQTTMIIDVVLSLIAKVCFEYMKSSSSDYFLSCLRFVNYF